MRNTWLIIKREYLERVRTRSFVVLTLLLPAIMTGVMVLPAKLATIGNKIQHIVVVTSTPEFGETVRQGLLSTTPDTDSEDDEANSGTNDAKTTNERYIIDVDSSPTEAERTLLREKIIAQSIDGYLCVTDDAIASGKIAWASRSLSGFGEKSRLSEKLNRVIQYTRLSKNGVTPDQADLLLKPVEVDAIRIEGGRETKDSGGKKFLEVVVMVTLIYMAVLLYGISVMRSVLEEKNTRILEVLLSSASSTELMTGKILGVGAVGLTQILVWVVMAGAFAIPSLAMQTDLGDLKVSPEVLAAFAVFFFLGYLLYST